MKQNKFFCFRFDVDTYKCLHSGVPNLLNLARDLDVKFTFFINFGQAINRLSSLRACIERSQNSHPKSLSALTKLGLRDYLYTLIFNPFIGEDSEQILEHIKENGHEIGLHGGKNHESWFRYAHTWTDDEIERQLQWGKQELKRCINTASGYGFASPGWDGSKKINNILYKLKFSYVADIHSDQPIQTISSINGLKTIPTNITGEPEGVAYIEYCRAVGMRDQDIFSDFQNKLMVRQKLAVVYEHPYYAGVTEIFVIKQLIRIAQDMGYKVVTMSEAVNEI